VQYLDDGSRTASVLHGIVTGPRPLALALDTEGASFHRFVDRIYLLQLTTRELSAIIDPLRVSPADLAPLGDLLADPQVDVIFHDADYDLRLLHQDYGWRATAIFDTRIAAQLLGIRSFGLAALLAEYFDVHLDKRYQRADWSMRPLTAEMRAYAAQDTRYLPELRDRLSAELDRLGRTSWAAEEFARLEGLAWPSDGGDAFLRVKGARDLSRRELAVLREVIAWRDGVAASLDRATFRVVGNEVLLAAARQQPPTRDALAALRGMPRGIMESRGPELLAAIERGRAVAEADLPRFPRSPRWDRDADFEGRVTRLKAVRDAAAARLNLDPGVLCSRERLEAIARRMPTSLEEMAELPDLRRWQIAELGPAFLGAL
jgi:ribonuclease D